MSKGNVFMGFGRGKVGSLVLARTKGQQVARAYNDKPKNPRSEGQMKQRSIFAAAIKFYTQGRQAFYQFAFENKSSKQSDYNAFVSANAKRGMNISQPAFEESTYPVLAPWQMSKGSLAELDVTYATESNVFRLELPGLAVGANWGDVSAILKSVYGLNEGDIVTVVTINAEGSTAVNTPAIEPEKRSFIKWDIKQLQIEEVSQTAITDIFGAGATAVSGAVTFTGVTTTANAGAACVTVSRITEEGLKVNDSYLALNAVAQTIYEAGKATGYINEVLQSWKATGKAILEGGLLPAPYIKPTISAFRGTSITTTNLKSISTSASGETLSDAANIGSGKSYFLIEGENLGFLKKADIVSNNPKVTVNSVTMQDQDAIVEFSYAGTTTEERAQLYILNVYSTQIDFV